MASRTNGDRATSHADRQTLIADAISYVAYRILANLGSDCHRPKVSRIRKTG
jgi:hypothetical protein